jgi:hypothetical protein
MTSSIDIQSHWVCCSIQGKILKKTNKMRFFDPFLHRFFFGVLYRLSRHPFLEAAMNRGQHQSNMWGSDVKFIILRGLGLGTRDRQCVMGLSGTFAVFFSHYCPSINETSHNLNQFVSIEA